MTRDEKELIDKINEALKGDEPNEKKDIKLLVDLYKYEVDDDGDEDTFFAKRVSRYFNGGCRYISKALDYFKYQTHRTVQNEINKFVCRYIKHIGAEDTRYDGRNEDSVKTLQKIRRLCEENDVFLY